MKFKANSVAVMTVLALVSCNNGGNTPAGTVPVSPISPTSPGGDATACLPGEHLASTGCAAYCNAGDSQCLRINEMPSDVDPTRKVAACETGIFDSDGCKLLTLKADSDGIKLLANTTERLAFDGTSLNLDRLELGTFEGAGYRVQYGYPTNFPTTPLQTKAFANAHMQFQEIGGTANVTFTASDFKDAALGRPNVNFYGFLFAMGPTSKAAFTSLCEKLPQSLIVQEAYGNFVLEELEANTKYVCGATDKVVPTYITLECNGNDCSINEVDITWKRKQSDSH